MRELPYVLTSSYQFLWERIVSIVERNMCLHVYLRNGELILIGAVLLDLSKAFHCIPHDILIAKLNAHGFDRETLKLIYSCLKGRIQSARINNIYSNFLELLSGVSQASILRAILFNVFLKDLLLFITKTFLHNYAHDNTSSASSTYVILLIKLLSQESNTLRFIGYY